MTQSQDYKRGYSKGYTTGCAKSSKADEQKRLLILDAGKRAERAESGAGIGHCDECANWTQPPNCSWGYCEASRQAGSPWGCWANGPTINDRHDMGRITTTPKFGCVLFQKREVQS